MKKSTIIVSILLTFLPALSFRAAADEGMWMLPLLKQLNSKQMKELGCNLTSDQIYSIRNSSLKDAIVQFGNGCTGEIISDRGLLVTNHHCGYGSIQKLSSVEHDYLKNGYWAMNSNEELPVKGLTVTFLEDMVDVTKVVDKARSKAIKKFGDSEQMKDTVNAEVDKAVQKIADQLKKDYPQSEVTVTPYYNSNVFYILVTKTFKDIRLVGAPPSSIGKFGADTDNWMWPRHTGDFSMFRVYADKDNNPAEYSSDNVPYTPKKHLKISLKGVNEGDYTMIMGFPGRTTRFQTSPELQMQIEQNDIRIAARTVRQRVMLEEMLADPKVKIQYASKYSSSSNGWKKWQGMKLAFGKLDIIARAMDEERAFEEWANADRKGKRQKEYGDAIKNLKACVESSRESNLAYTLANESIARIEMAVMAAYFNRGFKLALRECGDTLSALNQACNELSPVYSDYSLTVDRKEAKAMLEFYRENARVKDYPTGLDWDFATMDIDAYVDWLYSTSAFTSADKLAERVKENGYGIFMDPAFALYRAIISTIAGNAAAVSDGDRQLASARKNYTKGLLEWKKGQPMYPDANFTMRLTYGTVKGYSPKDGVLYRYYTTLDGVMEKEDPDNWEFVVPSKLKELWKAKDFGDYAMADGKMPVAFLSNTDITGGNSGSPIMNGNGELLGLAFDGNWESMSSDVMFEPDLQRCISVDIRYVLFIVDKFGGAGWLLDEMDLVK